MELNQKLSQLRKGKGLTQLELAEALNVSRQAVSRWEVGTAVPTLDNLIFLSRLYGVPLDDLIQSGAPVPAAPAEAPPEAGRLHISLVPLLLAVLILGVGILIGISLPRKEKISESGPNQRVMVDGPQGWLERTPTDIENELEWLEAAVKDLLGEEKTSP